MLCSMKNFLVGEFQSITTQSLYSRIFSKSVWNTYSSYWYYVIGFIIFGLANFVVANPYMQRMYLQINELLRQPRINC